MLPHPHDRGSLQTHLSVVVSKRKMSSFYCVCYTDSAIDMGLEPADSESRRRKTQDVF